MHRVCDCPPVPRPLGQFSNNFLPPSSLSLSLSLSLRRERGRFPCYPFCCNDANGIIKRRNDHETASFVTRFRRAPPLMDAIYCSVDRVNSPLIESTVRGRSLLSIFLPSFSSEASRLSSRFRANFVTFEFSSRRVARAVENFPSFQMKSYLFCLRLLSLRFFRDFYFPLVINFVSYVREIYGGENSRSGQPRAWNNTVTAITLRQNRSVYTEAFFCRVGTIEWFLMKNTDQLASRRFFYGECRVYKLENVRQRRKHN